MGSLLGWPNPSNALLPNSLRSLTASPDLESASADLPSHSVVAIETTWLSRSTKPSVNFGAPNVASVERFALFVEHSRSVQAAWQISRKSGDDPSRGAVARRGQEAGPDSRSKQVAGTCFAVTD